jgi:hypothetical protein
LAFVRLRIILFGLRTANTSLATRRVAHPPVVGHSDLLQQRQRRLPLYQPRPAPAYQVC